MISTTLIQNFLIFPLSLYIVENIYKSCGVNFFLNMEYDVYYNYYFISGYNRDLPGFKRFSVVGNIDRQIENYTDRYKVIWIDRFKLFVGKNIFFASFKDFIQKYQKKSSAFRGL